MGLPSCGKAMPSTFGHPHRHPFSFWKILWWFLMCFHLAMARSPYPSDSSSNPLLASSCHYGEYMVNLVPEEAETNFDTIRRIGEADHPGPTTSLATFVPSGAHVLTLGCCNPSGLRRKETEALSLGPGIWSFSESQLSAVTAGTCKTTLCRLARQLNRQVHVFTGAHASTRSTSSWAGSWTGVLALSDYKTREVKLPWPSGLYESGRVLTTHHMVNNFSIMVTTLYGFPKRSHFPQST